MDTIALWGFCWNDQFMLLAFAMEIMTLKIPPIIQLSSSDSYFWHVLIFCGSLKNDNEVNVSLLRTSKIRSSNLNSITKIDLQLIHILERFLSIIICALGDLHTPYILFKPLFFQPSKFQQIYYSCKAMVQEIQLETARKGGSLISTGDIPSPNMRGQKWSDVFRSKGPRYST